MRCHGNFHEVKGFFSGFTHADLREWQENRVAENRALYDAELAAKGQASAPTAGTPIPSRLDGFEPEAAALAFCAEYPTLGEQGCHDLTRLLKTAVKAGQGAF